MHSNQDDLDPEIVKELKDIMGENFILLFSTYISDSEKKIYDLKHAAHAKNNELIRRISHSLKGSSLNLGVIKVANLCNKLEENATQSNAMALNELVCEIDSEFSKVSQFINEMIV